MYEFDNKNSSYQMDSVLFGECGPFPDQARYYYNVYEKQEKELALDGAKAKSVKYLYAKSYPPFGNVELVYKAYITLYKFLAKCIDGFEFVDNTNSFIDTFSNENTSDDCTYCYINEKRLFELINFKMREAILAGKDVELWNEIKDSVKFLKYNNDYTTFLIWVYKYSNTLPAKTVTYITNLLIDAKIANLNEAEFTYDSNLKMFRILVDGLNYTHAKMFYNLFAKKQSAYLLSKCAKIKNGTRKIEITIDYKDRSFDDNFIKYLGIKYWNDIYNLAYSKHNRTDKKDFKEANKTLCERYLEVFKIKDKKLKMKIIF